jgi:aminopeptidase YwaD
MLDRILLLIFTPTRFMKKQLVFLLAFGSFFVLLMSAANAQTPGTQPAKNQLQTVASQTSAAHPAPEVCAACIRAHMEFLASDALRGRGSGTSDELVAATYIASQLRLYGIEPAGDDGGYIQRATLLRRKLTAPPILKFTMPGPPEQTVTWTYGKEFLAIYLAQTHFSAPLRQMDADKDEAKVVAGSVVLITGKVGSRVQKIAYSLASKGALAAIVMVPEGEHAQFFEEAGRHLPRMPGRLEGQRGSDLGGSNFNVLEVNAEAAKVLEQLPQDTMLQFYAPSTTEKGYTWNAVGKLPGSDPALQHAAVVLSAHLDHLGVGRPVNGDDIYNGADDDASGTTAVLELARVLCAGPRPQRTVIFALFGSEESGGLGSTYFREHPPLPLQEIAADLEFEMLGRPDSALNADEVWLTGWERSNLGPKLAAHGAHLVGDPHPDQNFFARSDNYVLAKKGVVAHTISSYGLHSDYHQPSDDLSHIDFTHMDAAIGSLLGPVEWLVNSSFTPTWNPGGQP